MKTKMYLILGIVCLTITFIFAGSFYAEAKTFKLTYSNFFPPTHIQSKLAEAWCKEVEKRTNGQVKVDYFPGQTLTKARQCYDGTVEGLSDIGFSVLAYTRGRFPVIAAVDLPLGYTSGKVATAVVNAVYEKFKPKELLDTEVMYLHAHGPGLIHTKGKAVKTLEDMKGLKFRVQPIPLYVEMVKGLGGEPTPIAWSELPNALATGVVDGQENPVDSALGSSVHAIGVGSAPNPFTISM